MTVVLWALWLACLGEHPDAALHHNNLYNDSKMPLRTARPLLSKDGGATNEAARLNVARSSYAKQVSSTHKVYVPGEVQRQRQSSSSHNVPGEEVQRQKQSSSGHKSYGFAKWPDREELWPSMSGRSTKRARISDDVPFKEDQSCSSTSKRSRISE